jgi:hypothetical protein
LHLFPAAALTPESAKIENELPTAINQVLAALIIWPHLVMGTISFVVAILYDPARFVFVVAFSYLILKYLNNQITI